MDLIKEKTNLIEHVHIICVLTFLLLNVLMVFISYQFFFLFFFSSSISVDSLEPEVKEMVEKLKIKDTVLYYNKGL